MENLIAIYFVEDDGSKFPLIVLDTNGEVGTMGTFLDWYAEAYGFDRTKLIGVWFNMIKFEKYKSV